MELWIVLVIMAAAYILGCITIYLVDRKEMEDHRKAAQAYFDMYTEAAETIADLVVFQNDERDLDENQLKLL